jgi:lipopolysaccharide/colanic/teichoic acid biosynthesis glycosyltransferase
VGYPHLCPLPGRVARASCDRQDERPRDPAGSHYFGILDVKRVFDVIVASVLLLALSPIFVVVALLVRYKLGSPIFFKQQRPGRGGRPFLMIKFRTMLDAADGVGKLLPDGERLTDFGRLLRSTSLDELPGLINVLRGDMSLVGPRPLLMQYLSLYSSEQGRRHEVRPGLTGWAQINGRNALSWEEKFALDVWYVDNHSFVLDIRILWQTVLKVLLRDGIAAAGEATMPPFTGSGRSEGA